MGRKPELTATLPIKLSNGNSGRTKTWFKAAKFRADVQSWLVLNGHRREPFEFPVSLVVTRLLGKGERLWDYSSGFRGNWKEIEDALVAVGWFHDDGPKWITTCDFRQDVSDRSAGPAVRIEVFQPEERS